MSPIRAFFAVALLLTVAFASLLPAQPARAAGLPPENLCPDFSGAAEEASGQDRGVPMIEPGMLIGLDDLMNLKRLFPEEVWDYREAFFYEGMRLEIGPCHRRYPVSDFYAAATERFRGQARVEEKGGLRDYVAGLPFIPDEIDPASEDAPLEWAWNFEKRYRGSGPMGAFRIVDMPGRIGKPLTFEGEFYLLQTAQRADLELTEFRMPESKKTLWVAGGEFFEPFSARHLKWRQFRPRKAQTSWREPDDTFVYVPTMRKPRRAASVWIDGLYTPRYTVAGDDGGGPLPFGMGGANDLPNIEAINPTAGLSIAQTEDIRRGFTGLALRPNAYEWKLLGMQEVLAPINGASQGWPTVGNRNYGPSGLSPASDRWDLRYAVVIEGRAKRIVSDVGYVTIWIDYQTQQPLYFITRRKNRLLLDVGILVHRFSGDQPIYPLWPGGEPANVFDPVMASFFWVPGGGGGWRRESYTVESLPRDPSKLRKLTTTDELQKGH